jgi:integrase
MNPVKITTDTGQVRWVVRWRQKVGNRTVRHKRTFTTRKAATDHIESLAAERRKDHDAAKRTFNDYADRYIASKRKKCKSNTVQGYIDALAHARAFLGDRQIGTLTASDAEAYLDYLTTLPNLRRISSLRTTYRLFSAVLKMATRDEALPSNPADKVDLPSPTTEPRFSARFLTSEEVARISNHIADKHHPTYGLLTRFMAYTGLRAAEVSGLEVQHLTLTRTANGHRGTVDVQQTKRRRPNPKPGEAAVIVDTPKSERSNRTVPLAPWLAAQLHDYLTTIHSSPSDPTAPLWPNRRRGGYTHGKRSPNSPTHHSLSYATPVEPGAFYRNIFKPAAEAAGLGKVRLHDLRHTFASLMAAQGVPVERVSAWMGHSSIVVTWTVYTHLFRGEDDHAAIAAIPAPTTATNVTPLHGRSAG